MRARLGEPAGGEGVGGGGRVGGRGGSRGGGGGRAAERGGQRGVDRGARRLVGGRVGVAARVVEGGVVGAAVEVGGVGRGGAAGGRVVAGPVGGRHGRVHRAPRRLRLGLVVRRGRVRVGPARLAGREVPLDVELDGPPEALAGVLRDAQYAALAEADLRREQVFAKLVREQLDGVEVLIDCGL